MDIHFQTTDHVVAVEKVAEQHIATKYSKCNSLTVISHIITLGKSPITHSKVGQSSPIPLAKDIDYHPVGQKFARNHSISYSLRDNCDFSHFH